MKIVWNDQSIEWFHSASDYTDYNKHLAKLLLERIPNRGTLCDIGCGAGLIDLELAEHFQQITCVDIVPEAVASLQRDIETTGILNVTAVCADGAKLEGTWDTVMTLFHGGKGVFSSYFPYVKDRLIIVTHGLREERFGPNKERCTHCFNIGGVREELNALGVQYTMTEEELEYGQPFKNLEDARRFVEAYTDEPEISKIEQYLETYLTKTEDERYPYYLPKKKKFGIFVIRRDENESIS